MIPDAILVDDTKLCPFCGEIIKQVAVKCRFCGEFLGVSEYPGVFREGKQLVMHKHSSLPARCIKSNAPVDRWLTRSLAWYPPIAYALLLLGPLPFIVAATMMRKRATVPIPMSTKVLRRRLYHILFAWLLIFVGIGLVVAAATNTNKRKETLVGSLVVVGFATIVVGTTYAVFASRPVKVSRITDSHIWLRGVHHDYLDALPEWPGNL
jgi:uncharacterized membrane protein